MKKILFLLFISSSLLALDNDSKGLMCEGADNKDKNRLDVWNSFEDLIIDSNEKKSLNELYEVVSIYQHTICGFEKHDAKITANGFLFYADAYSDCLNGSCNRILRCMYTFDDSSQTLQQSCSGVFDKNTSQSLTMADIFRDIQHYVRSKQIYNCKNESSSKVLQYTKNNTLEGLGEWNKKMEGGGETYKEYYCPSSILTKQKDYFK